MEDENADRKVSKERASNHEEQSGVFHLANSQPDENAHVQALQTVDRLLEVSGNIPVAVDDVVEVTFQLQQTLEKEAELGCLSARRLAAFEEHVHMVKMFVDAAQKRLDCVEALQKVAGHLLENVKRDAEQ